MMFPVLGLAMMQPGIEAQAFGTPQIMPFKGGRIAAVSLQFDDSMKSQVDNCLPLLAKYGLTATFFINPGRNDYPGMAEVWEVEVEKAGHELANHTWTHNGAVDLAHGQEEIDRWSTYFLEKRKGTARIVPFGIPGGVPWNITPAQLDTILMKDDMFLSSVRQFFQDDQHGDPAAPAKRALESHTWACMGFHGVAGQWLSTSVPNLSIVLDYLTANKDKVWTAVTGDVYKYIQERNSALPLELTAVSKRGFSLDLKTDPTKNRFSPDKQGLFDEPLTVRVSVPDTWNTVRTRVGKKSTPGQVVHEGGNAYAQFDVTPNAGPVRVEGK